MAAELNENCVCGQCFGCPDGWHSDDEPCSCTPDCLLGDDGPCPECGLHSVTGRVCAACGHEVPAGVDLTERALAETEQMLARLASMAAPDT